MYLPSNATSANVVLCYLDLNFLYQTLETLKSLISTAVRASAENVYHDFYIRWYLPSNGIIAHNVGAYSVTWLSKSMTKICILNATICAYKNSENNKTILSIMLSSFLLILTQISRSKILNGYFCKVDNYGQTLSEKCSCTLLNFKNVSDHILAW